MSEMITDVPGAKERRIADEKAAADKKAESRAEAAATARRIGESASKAGLDSDSSIADSQERLAQQLEDPDYEPQPMQNFNKITKIGGPEA